MKCTVISFLSSVLLGGLALAASDAGKEPIYIYLYSRVADHVNLDITEDRLHRLLPAIEKYREQHPDAHVSATVLFSGAVSQALADSNRETHIVDFVRGYIRRGVIEAGYDGSDEPTYQNRPTIDFTQTNTPQDRWLLRRTAEEKFLTEGRDPLTGASEAGKAGGLKKMQEVFGEAHCITGVNLLMRFGPGNLPPAAATRARVLDQGPKPVSLPSGLAPEVGGDSEAVEIIQTFDSNAIMFGMPDANPGRIPGFREGRADFSKLVSPVPESAPEIYWQDNVLRSSEASDDVIRLVHGANGAEPIKKLMEKADRSKIHVVHVMLAEEQNYLQPTFIKGPEFSPLQYAYDHPDAPKLPSDARRPKAEIDAAYAKEDELLNWVTEEYLPGRPRQPICFEYRFDAHGGTGHRFQRVDGWNAKRHWRNS